MSSNLRAPIFITVYDRIEHFHQCIASLQANPEAPETDLIIAIDGPKDAAAVTKNELIFDYCKKITGFKTVEILRRRYNLGSHHNAIQGLDYVMSKYSCFIRTEDDNIFSKTALKYFNDGLVKFEKNKKIYAICGYNEPCLNDTTTQGVYLRKGFSSFGWATWSEKRSKLDMLSHGLYSQFISPVKYLKMCNAMGDNVFLGLLASRIKGTVYVDYATNYHMYVNGMFSVSPKLSIVRNIGQDGTGMHSGICEEIQNQKIYDINLTDINLEAELKRGEDAQKAMVKWHRLSPVKKIVTYILYVTLFGIRKLFRGQ